MGKWDSEDDWDGGWPPYVSVAERRRKAAKQLAKMKKAGRHVAPIEIAGRKIAATFWGDAWCKNLESYSDYANRLPRGRTYVRNGSVLDLQIESGHVRSSVSGSRLYKVHIKVKPLAKPRWTGIKGKCVGQIDSLVELLQGSISKGVMEIVTRKGEGLFPSPAEISLSCSCPDWATMCKHVAATLYGVGARFDHEPEVLFTLRDVDPAEMVEAALKRPPSAEASPGVARCSPRTHCHRSSVSTSIRVGLHKPILRRPRKRRRVGQAKKKPTAKRSARQKKK